MASPIYLTGGMSKPPRDRTSFGSNTYFVTASTWGKRRLFQTDRMAGLFLDTLFRYRCQGKFLLHSFVVMPDHFHLLFTPCEITLERAVQFVKGGFSYRVKKELELNLEVWGRGYVDHRIRDANDYAGHVEYIHSNPVVAGMVHKAEEYAYSSAHAGFEVDACPRGLKPPMLGRLLRHV
jgi:REP-associated tyrosine transposase